MRLDNYISKALGITRSEAINIIKRKEITINDKIVVKKDTHIDEEKDIIKYNNQVLDYKEFVYIMLNKPQGVVSATVDKNDKTVVDLVNVKRDIFPVGRLDKDTEGLLLLTNNGKYAHFLTSPTHHVVKKYYVELEKEISLEDKNKFCNGLEIKDGNNEVFITKQAEMEILSNNSCFVFISEGKFHQIKRMFEKLNNKVIYLKRVQFGDIKLDESLKPGEYRELTEEEIKMFKREI